MADPSDMINSANAQYGSGNFAAALEGYDMVLAAGVEDTAVYANRGAALLALSRHSEAHESLVKAIELDEDSVNGHVNMGLVLKAMDRLDEAAASFERAQALDTDSYEAFAGGSIVLNQMERWSDATEAAERALQLRPGDSNAAFQRAIACSGAGNEISTSDIATIRASENAANVPILLGKQAHVLSTDAASTSKYYGMLLEVEATATNYFNFAITLLTKQGSQAEALEALLKAIEIDPTMHQPLIQAGTLEVQAKDFQAACGHFLQALQVRVGKGEAIEDHSFFYNYAVALLHTQKYADAKAKMEECLFLKVRVCAYQPRARRHPRLASSRPACALLDWRRVRRAHAVPSLPPSARSSSLILLLPPQPDFDPAIQAMKQIEYLLASAPAAASSAGSAAAATARPAAVANPGPPPAPTAKQAAAVEAVQGETEVLAEVPKKAKKPKKSKKSAKSAPAAAVWPPTRAFEVVEYDDIIAKANLPDDFDVTMKEQYLSDEDFEEMFGMDKGAFNALAKWKRNAEKKKHGLF